MYLTSAHLLIFYTLYLKNVDTFLLFPYSKQENVFLDIRQ